MRVGDAESDRAPDHELVLAPREGPFEAEGPESTNQFGAANRPEGGHDLRYGPNRQLVSVDDGEWKVPRDAEEDPLFQDLPQLLATVLERRCVRVHAVEPLDLAVERAVVRQDLVASFAERDREVLGDHGGIVLLSSAGGNRA